MNINPDLAKLFSSIHSLLGYIDSADTFKESSAQPSKQWLEGLKQYADRVEAELKAVCSGPDRGAKP